MRDEQDDYLWRAEPPIEAGEAELVELEQALAELRWRPRALALDGEVSELAAPGASPLARVVELDPARRRGIQRPGLLTALLAAAAVFALLLLRPRVEAPPAPAPTPTLTPAASPDRPDLKDPFGPRGDGFDAPSPTPPAKVSPRLQDPFAAGGDDSPQTAEGQTAPSAKRRVIPDLLDPFADSSPAAAPEPEPRPPGQVSPDLADPFGARDDDDAGDEPGEARRPKLVDPFTGQPKPVDPNSPDLKDPFSSRD